MAPLPVGVVGRVTSDEASELWARFLKIEDDHPGGIYVFHCDSGEFTDTVYDSWFESWDDVARFVSSLGEIVWTEPSSLVTAVP